MMESGTLCLFVQRVEWHYNIHDKELLGVMHALEAWCHYLEGCKHKFKIWTDHKNLQYFMESKKLNHHQAQWSLYLSQFNFVLVHKPGPTMEKANTLSRCVDHKEGVEHDNKNITLLKPMYFKVHTLCQGHLLIEGKENVLLLKIRKSRDLDKSVVKAVEEFKKFSTKHLWSEEWTKEQRLILYRGKVCVQKDHQLRVEIIKLHYDTPSSGHPGQWKTLELVTCNYWWPGITSQVKRYVTGCNCCQRMKSFPEKPTGKLGPNEATSIPWKDITMDFITRLPEAQGLWCSLFYVLPSHKTGTYYSYYYGSLG